MNDLLHLFLRLPFPIQIGTFIFILWAISKVLGQGPTEERPDRRLPDPMDATPRQNSDPMTMPPPLPSPQSRKNKRGRKQGQTDLQRAAATFAAEKVARVEQAERTAIRNAQSAAADRAAAVVAPTAASNIRRALQRNGARDAFILSEVLGKPKSAE